jgi:hypothetical protein
MAFRASHLFLSSSVRWRGWKCALRGIAAAARLCRFQSRKGYTSQKPVDRQSSIGGEYCAWQRGVISVGFFRSSAGRGGIESTESGTNHGASARSSTRGHSASAPNIPLSPLQGALGVAPPDGSFPPLSPGSRARRRPVRTAAISICAN